jgi:DNA-binding HxlR family transcriptional regulator
VRSDHRSGCPISLTLEVLGDKWSLLIIRDVIFDNRRHFRELLVKSEEGVASNILADRVKRLVEQGIITRSSDPSHKQKSIYSLTEQGIELLPVLAQMAGWGRKYLPVTNQHSSSAKLLDEGGPKMWSKFMSELRALHLGAATRRKSTSAVPSIAAELLAANKAGATRSTVSKKKPRRRRTAKLRDRKHAITVKRNKTMS